MTQTSKTQTKGEESMDNKKYLIWNNKGGVGKTFLSYALAVEYALQHPNEDVVVIDACPQSNISEMILGGNGEGEEALDKLRGLNRTIAGYIKERFNTSQLNKLGTEVTFFVKVDEINPRMPPNLYLLPGDIDLDICAKLVAHIGTSPVRNAWKYSRSLLVDLVNSFELNKETNNEKKTFFIDSNPSFAIYTELAILASNRVIAPCTADAASIRGIKNLVTLIYGISIGNQSIEDEFLTFCKEVSENQLTAPLLHLFILNRSRTNTSNATKAFRSHAEEIDSIASALYKQHPNIFTNIPSQNRVMNVKDGNTLAAIINHEGCPISNLQHKKYSIYGKETQANKDQIDSLFSDINNVVACL